MLKVKIIDEGDASVGMSEVVVYEAKLDMGMSDHIVDNEYIKTFAEQILKFVETWYEPEIWYFIEVEDEYHSILLQGTKSRINGKVYWTDLNEINVEEL